MTRHPMDNVQTYAMIQENIALLEQKLQTKIDAMCTWLKQHEEYIEDFDASMSHLNKIAKEQLKGTNPKEIIFNEVCFFPPDVFDKVIPKIHHPSRKHLEGKLREKNQLIKQMDETTDYLNEQLDKKDDRIRDLEKQLAARNAECQKKDQHIDQLIKGRDLLLEKINHLRSIRSMGEKCDRPCCRPAPASYL